MQPYFQPWSFQPDVVNDWGCKDGVLSPAECAQVIALGDSLQAEPGTVGGVPEKSHADISVRDSKVAWIKPDLKEAEWLFRKLQAVILEANQQLFQFDIWGLNEPLQLTRYDAPSGKYDMHCDRIPGGHVIRKMSFSILLSDPKEFEGGDLLIQTANHPQPMPKKQGTFVAFPSFVLHGVTPVTGGTRHSLVGWVAGKSFK